MREIIRRKDFNHRYKFVKKYQPQTCKKDTFNPTKSPSPPKQNGEEKENEGFMLREPNPSLTRMAFSPTIFFFQQGNLKFGNEEFSTLKEFLTCYQMCPKGSFVFFTWYMKDDFIYLMNIYIYVYVNVK